MLQHSRAGTRNHIIGLNNKDTNKYVSSKLFYSIDGTVDVSGNNVEKNDNINNDDGNLFFVILSFIERLSLDFIFIDK